VKTVVTGGSGFIGSHVVDKLVAAGHDVVVFDSLVRSLNPEAQYVEGDVLDPSAATRATKGADVVFHLAGMSNVDVAALHPLMTVKLNVEGTAVIADAARDNDARVVLASTVWVFGAAAGEGTVDESAVIDLERSGHLYTSTKLAAEMVLHSYAELYDVPFTILRYGVPYGPRMRDELVIAKFVGKALRGEPLTVAGDGSQTRNFLYVEDLADAHVLALGDAAVNQTFAVDGTEAVSIRQVAETVARLVGDVQVERVPGRSGDFAGRPVDITHAREMLGWSPSTTFEQGVQRYLEWLRAPEEPLPVVTTD
jgi:UDP-glucose 4-epimerase